MKKIRRFIMVMVCLAIFLGFLEYKGIIWHNDFFAMKYKIKGLDVSHHQGKIDWKEVSNHNSFRFVYIKATEGEDFVDEQFLTNWQAAQKYMAIGAYHFFSMENTGEAQAALFIKTVPKQEGSLPPVIDLEIGLGYDQEKVKLQLHKMVELLQQYYGKKPMLYVTYDTYNKYIKGDFPEQDIWLRDILKHPKLEQRKWVLWQFNNRGKVQGIAEYVDINVFNMDEFDFTDFIAR
ncbi:glycoside hydrolase [Paenibacillus psychroresistens]|uniref:Glycoside hydrolase n=1 Tax=Paenibacillus psychroresistens TaxID=1778678 RepID=A0A6B8RC37_9BACL|nr:GH25 family lysozyme [Paenibacillus psychroresistens]QGQ94091.1 glycoside hydrolase [Paenibacillus psychroresistens]